MSSRRGQIRRIEKECSYCGETYTAHPERKSCNRCNEIRVKIKAKAHMLVKLAIDAGHLPKLTNKSSRIKCKDCGKPAKCYDHRDYKYGLLVDPVCKSCDIKRGAGKNSFNQNLIL